MAVLQLDYWTIGWGALLLALLTLGGLWYFFPIHFHKPKFKE